jgi:alpha-beta hydrolase superfamily lysophospholipase
MTESGGERLVAPPAVRSIDAAGGVALLYRAWEVDRPRARVRIIHGLGEHSGRYTPLAAALVERGFSCYAADLRGHGVSGGRRGHVGRFDEYLDDLQRLTVATQGDEPALLFGHSLGGLIAVRAMQTGSAGELTGTVLSAPALDLAAPLPWWRDPAATLLSRVAPTLALPNGINPDDLSHDPAAVTAYRTDPLVHDRITPRLFAEMRRAMRAAADEAGKVRVPVLLLAPGDDRITNVDAAVWVVDRFYGEVCVRAYPQLYHEPLQEEERGAILTEVLEWIEQRIA